MVQRRANGVSVVTLTLRENPNPSYTRQATNSQQQEAWKVLYRWRRGESSDAPKASTTLQRNGGVRLDLQGMYLKRNINWSNPKR